ncbi:MAG: hypothetical protein M3092_01185, partial [Actinomycetia bacterium]|nr:hypothetical protein [Actinomycetes bacterium]
RCEPVAPSMDLFALGIVLYKAATGTAPFPSTKDDDGNRVYPQLTSRPDPVSDLAPGVEPPLASAIHRLLEPEPSDRTASASDALRDLAAALPDGEGPLWPDWASEFLH